MTDKINNNYDKEANKKSSTGLDPKIANLLSYLFSWLGGLIIWLLEKENRFVKWNALQALILGIAQMISIMPDLVSSSSKTHDMCIAWR